jgi:uncharacterized membrane protein
MLARMSDTLYVLAASYDGVNDALAEYETIEVAYRHVGSTHDFDAAVIAKDEAGKVKIVRRHEEPKRHGAAVGLNWGLAAGAVAALFPAVGIIGALAVGGGAGAALGAVAGHASGGMSREDLMALGDVLDRGDAGLVVVYAADMADRVTSNVNAAHSQVTRTTTVTAEQLAEDVREAEASAAG